jgi:hypothetical protein
LLASTLSKKKRGKKTVRRAEKLEIKYEAEDEDEDEDEEQMTSLPVTSLPDSILGVEGWTAFRATKASDDANRAAAVQVSGDCKDGSRARLLQIVRLQGFDGGFAPHQCLVSLMSDDLEQKLQQGDTNAPFFQALLADPCARATLLALYYLKKCFSESAGQWRLVYDKALGWLAAQAKAMDIAKATLRSTVDAFLAIATATLA